MASENRRKEGKMEPLAKTSGRNPVPPTFSAVDAKVGREPSIQPNSYRTPYLAKIERVVSDYNMQEAMKAVIRNKGAAGIDWIMTEEIRDVMEKEWSRIKQEILDGKYRPKPVRRVEMPKPDGKGVRQLGIPTVLDRVIQQAIYQELVFVFEPGFSENSYGFRRERRAQQAVLRAQEYIQAGCTWVVDIDLEKFFDKVNHDILMSKVARKVGDKKILLLIRRFLQAGVVEGGLVKTSEEGTPQGGLCKALHKPPYAKKVIMQSKSGRLLSTRSG